jgi:S1-C subfamily serine protease
MPAKNAQFLQRHKRGQSPFLTMGGAGMVLVLLAVSGVAGERVDQGQAVLRVRVTLADGANAPAPLVRHALLISDDPPTREPRRILTGADGTATITLPPGAYVVESDRPAVFGGRALQWTQFVTLAAGRELTLELTADNAEAVPVSSVPDPPAREAAQQTASDLLATWQRSVVGVWSPISLATGFVVDARGVIATDRRAIGTADVVAVQVAPDVRVPARVLASDRARDVALVWVDPSAVADRAPIPLPCPPAVAPPLDEGQRIVVIQAPYQANASLEDGDVTALQPREVTTDLRLSFGGAGGPAFNDAGAIVGLTATAIDGDARRAGDVTIVRTIFICEALSAALPSLAGVAPPEPARLPLDSPRAYPADALAAAAKASAASIPPMLTSEDFEVALLTPPAWYHAEQRSGRTGGTRARSVEAEARLGRLTDFGAWSGYFADAPPVVVVRVTPKLVEGFWKRLGREAARTQGAVLPPFKDFKTSFHRLRATCGGDEVTPIHPFVLEHRVSEKTMVREGLYVFDAEAFGPQCATVTLSLYSEAQPERAQTVTVSRTTIDRIWQDFAAWRAAGQ